MVEFIYKMRRHELLGIVLLVATLCFAFGSFGISIWLLVNQISAADNVHPGPCPQPKPAPRPAGGPVNNSAGFKAASQLLLQGMDPSVDPCQDFYAFTCNNLARNHLLAPGKHTYNEADRLVAEAIRKSIEQMDVPTTANSLSQTEKIVQKIYQICMAAESTTDHSAEINTDVLSALGGMPAVVDGWQPPQGGWDQFWIALGQLEAKFQITHLFASMVSVDYEQHGRHALYLQQPRLTLPRDYFVKPQFLDKLNNYRTGLIQTVTKFAAKMSDGKSTVDSAKIEQAVTQALAFEVQLAMAAYSDELSRNYRLQYNQYSVADLAMRYPSIGWAAYFSGLGLNVNDSTSLVLVTPRFFAFLDVVLQGNQWSQETLTNLVAMRVLLAYADLGMLGPVDEAQRKMLAMPGLRSYMAVASHRHRRESRRHGSSPKLGGQRAGIAAIKDSDEQAQHCIGLISDEMPHGTGFVYVKGIGERDAIAEDVRMQTELVIESFGQMLDSLDWLKAESRDRARNKSDHLRKNVGWPRELYGDFNDTKLLDQYNSRYAPLLSLKSANMFHVVNALRKAGQQTENLDLLAQEPSRAFFGGSPATVNAWYQPERNSITFPLAALNPPYYRFDFPQAFNFGGQGGTGGHELSHGFDDEGVQFGPEGELSDCTWNNCGWMDANSSLSFSKMAQCVVQQYTLKCCPVKSGNVRCANGANTQGENITDLAGQQAAYKAYRMFVEQQRGGEEEPLLPGLEQYTPNQIFWIAYGYSWCMNLDEETLAQKLLIDEHAPGPCRVNQVVQDIPDFGRDFNCPVGSPMRPVAQDRCQVWIG